jgi:hypothetical protein
VPPVATEAIRPGSPVGASGDPTQEQDGAGERIKEAAIVTVLATGTVGSKLNPHILKKINKAFPYPARVARNVGAAAKTGVAKGGKAGAKRTVTAVKRANGSGFPERIGAKLRSAVGGQATKAGKFGAAKFTKAFPKTAAKAGPKVAAMSAKAGKAATAIRTTAAAARTAAAGTKFAAAGASAASGVGAVAMAAGQAAMSVAKGGLKLMKAMLK